LGRVEKLNVALLQWQMERFLNLLKKKTMSSAFVKESSDQQWLHEVEGTVAALKIYLTRENGTRVFEQRSFIDPKSQKEIHVMSNGLDYSKDAEGKWYVVI
jgi:hypothetical protein